jgi:hypothetical protein
MYDNVFIYYLLFNYSTQIDYVYLMILINIIKGYSHRCIYIK